MRNDCVTDLARHLPAPARSLRHPPMSLSVVIPVLNEVDNVGPLHAELAAALQSTRREWEILFVDDGSTDGTAERLRRLAMTCPATRLIRLRRSFGQTAALQAGFDHAAHDVIVILDGDRQNDPRDIPQLIEHIDNGYDLVHGWRKQRQDTWLDRRLPSVLANGLIRRATGFAARDLGCALKVIRRDIALELELYGEMHRFIPILAHQRGARCLECVVRHRPRVAGETKYGLSRTLRVILDLLTVLFLIRYLASPMKLFGRFGLLSGLIAAVSGGATVAMKLLRGVDMTGNPLLLLTILSLIAAIQFFGMGLLCEVCARIYYRDGRRNYAVREIVNAAEDGRHGAPVRRVA